MSFQQNYSNDFDYPSLNRKDLMVLDTIRDRDFPIRKINQINTNRDWSTNLYNLDIEKSVPFKTGIYINKIDYTNKNDDIEKSSPSKEKMWNKPDFCLNIKDIEKAYPNKASISQRHINPLNPVYKLPSFPKTDPPIPLKFIRNQIDISDIEKSRPSKLYTVKMRPEKNYDEIGDNHPKKPYERKKFYDSYNYNDVTDNKKKFRNTNPLDPDYGNYGGFIDGSKPLINGYQWNNVNKDSLYIDDILGSCPGSKNSYSNFRYDNKERFDTRDIDGATADSKKYGISTLRCTNPLQPNYQYIGESENLDLYGKIENYDEQHYHRYNNNLSLSSSINNINDANLFKNNFYNIPNKNNNLYFSQDFHNIISQKKRSNKKITKSRSCIEMNPFTKSDQNKNDCGINFDLLPEFSTKVNNENNYYIDPEHYFHSKHDSSLVSSRVNKDNRLDYKLKQYYNKNDPMFRNRISSALKNRTNEVNKNENDTLYQNLNFNKPNTYEEQLVSVIKSNQIPNYY